MSVNATIGGSGTLNFPNGSFEPNGMRWTALHAAASGGHPEVVRFLVQAGGDVNATDGARTPLLYAVRPNEKRPEWRQSVVILLSAGADVNARTTDMGFNLPAGNAAIHIAADDGDLPLLDLLLTAGADVNSLNTDGCTALDIAREMASALRWEPSERRFRAVEQRLLEHGAIHGAGCPPAPATLPRQRGGAIRRVD